MSRACVCVTTVEVFVSNKGHSYYSSRRCYTTELEINKINLLLPAGNVCDEAEVVILLDASSSVRSHNWNTWLHAVRELVRIMADTTKWAMETFHVGTTVQFGFSTYSDTLAVQLRVEDTHYDMGTTNLAAGTCKYAQKMILGLDIFPAQLVAGQIGPNRS